MPQLWPNAQTNGSDGRVAPIQAFRHAYTITAADVSAGNLQQSIPLPLPYADSNYTILCQYEDDDLDALPSNAGELITVTFVGPTAFTIIQSTGNLSAGDVVIFHVLVIHD